MLRKFIILGTTFVLTLGTSIAGFSYLENTKKNPASLYARAIQEGPINWFGPNGYVNPVYQIRDCANPCVVENSQGGVEDNYLAAAWKLSQEKRPVRIRQNCYSACTVLADYLRTQNLVCVEPGAALHFHRGSVRRPDGTEMPSIPFAERPYNGDIKLWLANQPVHADDRWMSLQGEELHRYIRVCDK